MSRQKERDSAARLELAGRAFKEFSPQCFWSYRDDFQISGRQGGF